MAGLGTTGVLIASFFLLLTVGSTLVAFRGVPGAASNGDLSTIELRQQQEAAQRGGELLVATDLFDGDRPAGESASDDVLGRLATSAASGPAGRIWQNGQGGFGSDALGPGTPREPVGDRTPPPSDPTPPPSSGVVEAPVAPGELADDTTAPTTDTGSGPATDSGTGTPTPGSDTGSGTGGGGSGTDEPTTGGPGTPEPGTGTGETPGTGTGGTGSDGGDPVTTPTEPVGSTGGGTAEGGGQAVGGLLQDATTVVGSLTGG